MHLVQLHCFHFNPRSREGSDNSAMFLYPDSTNFNPRSREGSDSKIYRFHQSSCRFQSTLPRRERLIGCLVFLPKLRFQSTLPRRERQRLWGYNVYAVWISIHAPAKGATVPLLLRYTIYHYISIHAPAKGATKGRL